MKLPTVVTAMYRYRLAEAQYLVRCQLLHAKHSLEESMFQASKIVSFDRVYGIIRNLNMIKNVLHSKEKQFLMGLEHVGKLKPRLIRLSERLEWNDKELQAMIYILMKETSQEDLDSSWKVRFKLFRR